ncbi:MAG: hypothetical protein JF606_17935 [Burkholderiales bacterium]|jgi:type III secretion protein HrpB1|nr:hypothetical protein [Burkholderiales bacterium]
MNTKAEAIAVLAESVAEALRGDRIDEAESLFGELCELMPEAEKIPVFRTLIAIQRNQTLEALQQLNMLPEGQCPELKALCLYILGDPSWHGCATALVDDSDVHVRTAMRQLLCMEEG